MHSTRAKPKSKRPRRGPPLPRPAAPPSEADLTARVYLWIVTVRQVIDRLYVEAGELRDEARKVTSPLSGLLRVDALNSIRDGLQSADSHAIDLFANCITTGDAAILPDVLTMVRRVKGGQSK